MSMIHFSMVRPNSSAVSLYSDQHSSSTFGMTIRKMAAMMVSRSVLPLLRDVIMNVMRFRVILRLVFWK
jgi:hypothetical protein